jgi:superfamily II helicase
LRDALPGRAQTAIATAVRLVTPATRPVTIDRHVVLTTPADVEAWVMRQWDRLSEAITRGPALVE